MYLVLAYEDGGNKSTITLIKSVHVKTKADLCHIIYCLFFQTQISFNTMLFRPILHVVSDRSVTYKAFLNLVVADWKLLVLRMRRRNWYMRYRCWERRWTLLLGHREMLYVLLLPPYIFCWQFNLDISPPPNLGIGLVHMCVCPSSRPFICPSQKRLIGISSYPSADVSAMVRKWCPSFRNFDIIYHDRWTDIFTDPPKKYCFFKLGNCCTVQLIKYCILDFVFMIFARVFTNGFQIGIWWLWTECRPRQLLVILAQFSRSQ